MNHRRRCTSSISIFILVHLAILREANSFSPFFLGPEFRNTSFVNEGMNDRLAEICGRSKRIGEREYPWAVSIMLENGVNRLGGSIISPYHILTVAHGFMNFHGGDERPCMMTVYRPLVEIRSRIVGYGGRCIRGYSDVLPNHPDCPEPDVTFNRIRSVLIDETFVRQGCHHGHDWAIVELEERIEFTDKQKPICLPPPSLTVEPVIITAGWGRSYIFNESGPLIHEIPMVVDPKCDRPRTDKLPSKAADYICATSMDMDDYFAPRTCHGDSGAGMEQIDERGRSILVALTSFGTKGCPSNELARFTRVDHYLQPICAHTGICYSYIGRIIRRSSNNL
ncbi:unnamed protein product [Cylicocyclus nassatus]|uniref:Peptidase S1 domain-containing protein n=1 Tax=Cylicocyclus nassatus TaxID=53992 RepID=A0AA36GFI4_CYLNA|nr:unnamed protein product [Cylicocyclus nassatus]